MLNNEWRACQRSLILKQGQLLCLTALTAGSLCLLTQFMSSHGPCFLLAISWIFRSKNACLVFLTVFLNCFQSLIYFVTLYFSRSLLQLAFHQLLDCLVILTIFEFSSIVWASDQIMSSRESIFDKLLVLISLKALINSVIKFFSSLLSLMIVHFLV